MSVSDTDPNPGIRSKFSLVKDSEAKNDLSGFKRIFFRPKNLALSLDWQQKAEQRPAGLSESSARIFKQSMGARIRVGIGLPYR
jgi:hypothetical protein